MPPPEPPPGPPRRCGRPPPNRSAIASAPCTAFTRAGSIRSRAVDGSPVATLRTYVDADGGAHLGRVATAAAHRGQGYAAALVEEALRRCGKRPVLIGAQTYLEGWYGRFGFVRDGADYPDDGIPHLPMRRG